MNLQERLNGCLVCGAIGDSIGGFYEGTDSNEAINFDFVWSISDDTQLTLATCEAIYNSQKVSPEKVAANFLNWYNQKKLTGLGASTLKALRELQVGGHWALVGRSGEYAAGNGAAMRIAPLAFKETIELLTIKDICTITHKNDEAYIGALAIYYSIRNSIKEQWIGENDLISQIIPYLPDTRVRDRLIEFENQKESSIFELGQKFKPSGYVVDSVPIAIFAAQKINQQDYKTIITELIQIGGDTDTTCSMAGQIIGALKGIDVVPKEWLIKYQNLYISSLINKIVQNWE